MQSTHQSIMHDIPCGYFYACYMLLTNKNNVNSVIIYMNQIASTRYFNLIMCMYKLFNNIILSLFTLLLSCKSVASDKEKHIKDAEDCFGTTIHVMKPSKTYFHRLLDSIYSEMDQGGNNLQGKRIQRILHHDKIYDKYPKISTGDYGHRLFFHYGYRTNNSIHPIPPLLREQLEKACNKDTKLYKEYLHDFEKIYRDEQADFEQDLDSKVRSTPNFQRLSRSEREALIKIIYNIHILGDYSTAEVGSLMPLGDLREDLRKAIEKLGCEDYALLNQFTDRDNIPRSGNDKTDAEILLNALKVWLPKIIEKTPKIKDAVWN